MRRSFDNKFLILLILLPLILIIGLIYGIYCLFATKKEKKPKDLPANKSPDWKSYWAVKNARKRHNRQLQKDWIKLTTPLANNPQIHAYFTNLLKSALQQFAKNKQIDTSQTPPGIRGILCGWKPN